MTILSTLVVQIVGDITKYTESLDKSEALTAGFTSRAVGGLSSLGSSVVVGGIAAAGVGIAALGAGLQSATAEAMAAEGIMTQTQAVISSTGGAAGMSADSVADLATSLSQVTKFEDDTIQSAENMLLTFTNIGRDVFPAATETVLDMSQALGQDLKSSSVQLGKALNDPVAGITALSRVGVTFTDEQKTMIESMVASGDVMGAQKLILAELSREFGGSARAAGQTAEGGWAIFGNMVGNIKESVGAGLLPALSSLGQTLSTVVAKPEVQAFFENLGAAIGTLATQAVTYLPVFVANVQAAFTWLDENRGIIVAALAVIGASLAAFAYTSLAAAIPAMVAFVAASWPVIAVVAAIGGAAYLLYTAWTENWGGIQQKTQGVIDFIKGLIDAGMQFINDLTSGRLGWLSDLWTTTTNSIRLVVDTWFANIKLLFAAFRAAFSGDWRGFGQLLRQVWDNNWTLLTTLASNGFENFKTMIGGLITNVVEIFKTTDWGEVGKNIITGIADGIRFATQWLIDANLNTLKAVLDAIKGFLGIASPSLVMKTQVGWQMGAGVLSGWDESMKEMETLMPRSMANLVPAPENIKMPSGSRNFRSADGPASGQQIVLNYSNNAMLSVADEQDIARKLAPIIANIVGVEIERKLARRGI